MIKIPHCIDGSQGCSNPCTCFFEHDGDRPNTNYTKPWQDGRYNTRIKGSGTAASPYVIEFLDSEEFQVEAAQAHSTGDMTLTNNGSGSDGSYAIHINQIDYETPNEIFLAFSIQEAGSFSHQFYLSANRFWHVSAQATFVSNGLNSGMRRIFIYFNGPTGDYGLDGSTAIAGATSSSISTSEDITLSCSGYAPFMDAEDEPEFNGPYGRMVIGLMQSSGSSMTIRDIRFTVVAL